MNKIIKLVSVVLMTFLFSFMTISGSHAFELGSTDQNSGNLSLPSQENISSNYFGFGNNVNIDGNVLGDLFSAGNQIGLNGNINNNAFIAGNVIVIKGHIDRDAFIAGSDIIIDKSAVIEGDLSVAGNNITINGIVKGKVNVGASTLNINGEVGKDIKAGVQNFNVNSTAIINGNVNYSSNNTAKIDTSAIINGNIQKSEPAVSSSDSFMSRIYSFLISLLSTLLVGIIILSIMPNKSVEISQMIKNKFWSSLGIGFLASIAVPVAFVILILIMIGWPLALILLALYFTLVYLTTIFTGLCIGNWLSKDKWAKIWSMTLGVFILSVLYMIPIIGMLTSIIVLFIGLGSVSLVLFKKNK